MNNIIIMSYNYYPDISPSSFRMNSLVQNLKKVSNEKINISVICSQPSRYNVKHQTTQTESINSNIKIYRSRKINITKTFFDSVISFADPSTNFGLNYEFNKSKKDKKGNITQKKKRNLRNNEKKDNSSNIIKLPNFKKN